MDPILTFLETLGEVSLRLWLPMLGWTVIAAVTVWALNRARTMTPRLHYILRRTLLIALPLGLLLSLTSTVSFRSFLPAEVVYVQSIAPATDAATVPVPPTMEAASPAMSLTWWHGLGLLTLLVGITSLIQCIRVMRHVVVLNRFRRTLRRSADPMLQGVIDRLARQQGLQRPIDGALSSDMSVPLTFGWRRPIIVIPKSLRDDAVGLRLAVTHELVHIRWHDYAWHALEQFIGALFVIHPFVSRLRDEIGMHRELACDADVLAQPWTSRRRYAKLLLSFVTPPKTRPLALGIAPENQSQIRQRIDAMTAKPHSPFFSPKGIGLLLTSFVLGAATLFVVFSDWFGTERQTIIIEKRMPEAPTAPEAPLPPLPPSSDVFTIVEQMPQLIGGLQALQSEISYPLIAKNAGIEGRVFLQFIVDAEGNVVQPEVVRGIGGGCDAEAVRALMQMRFRPGKQRGEAVPVKMSLPVTFKLSGNLSSAPPPPPPPPSEVFVVVEQMPELIGGLQALQSKIRYPQIAKKAGIEGRVFIEFIVDPQGNVVQPKVLRGIGGGCDEEALRALQQVKFRPGKQRGKAVHVKLALPVTFKLAGDRSEAVRGESQSEETDESRMVARIRVEDPATMGDQLRVADINRGAGILEGVIRNADTDAPVAGVNVIVDGTTAGAVTDLDGRFVLHNIPDGATTLTVSHISYESMRIDLR